MANATGSQRMSQDPISLVELLEASVEKHRSRTLFLNKSEGRWIETDYESFARTVDQLRAGLGSLGVGVGDKVGIISNNRIEWAAAAFATAGLGAAFVPMYENQLEREWAFIVRDSGMKVLFVSTLALHTRVAPLQQTIPTLAKVVLLEGEGATLTYRGLLQQGARAPAAPRHPRASDTAALLYTSGTTGEPKGVVLSHGNILSNVNALHSLVPLGEDHRSLSFLPWAHAFGYTVELILIIRAGASSAIAEGVDKIPENLVEVRPTVLVAVPRVFMRVYAGVQKLIAARPAPIRWLFRRGIEAATARAAGKPLDPVASLVRWLADKVLFSKIRARFGGRLQFAVSGAAALAKEVGEFIDSLGIAVYEGYGLTETSPVVSANAPGARKLGSVGRPLPGVRVAIDHTGSTESRHGEIVVYGPNLMQGYHNRPTDSAALFTADGGLRTGDLGFLDEDGFLFISGRIKEQYKLTNGKYVVPSPLEERLKMSPFVANVMIHGDNRPHNVALVVPQVEQLADWAGRQGITAAGPAELVALPGVRDKIRSEIDRLSTDWKGYERIQSFALILEDFTLENGMLTPSLKLRRHQAARRWGAELQALYPPELLQETI
jgi:long-chain acyl-CoA synthetase